MTFWPTGPSRQTWFKFGHQSEPLCKLISSWVTIFPRFWGDERYFVTWLIGQVWTCLKWNKRVDSFLIGFKFRYGYDILGSAVEFFVCGKVASNGAKVVWSRTWIFINYRLQEQILKKLYRNFKTWENASLNRRGMKVSNNATLKKHHCAAMWCAC